MTEKTDTPKRPRGQPAKKPFTPPAAFKPPDELPERDPVTGTWLGKESKMLANSFDAFKAWYTDRQPRILTRGKYEYVELTRHQELALKNMLATTPAGKFQFGTSLIIWPRRHSKSVLLRLVCLWLFDTRSNQNIQLWGNGELHCRRVQFNPICKTILNTPALRKRIPEKNLQRYEILHGKNGSRIQVQVGSSVAFGDQIDVLYLDDYHHQSDLESVNALLASLLDSPDSLLLIGSNVDPADGHVHALQKQAKDDGGIYADYLQYVDWEHYERMAPAWIDQARARRLEKTLLPSEFARDILGQRTQAQNSLFAMSDIEACKETYHGPVIDLDALTQGRSYKIGAGLDRSKALLGSVTGHDNTIFTVIAKVSRPDGEPEIYVLDQVKVIPNTAQMIKKHIREANERYRLNNFVIEDYMAVDLEPWCIEQNIPCELISAHSTRQNAMFPELHRLVKEHRLHYPANGDKLAGELASFTYSALKGGKYSFGASGSHHDDRVYSLGWAIYALRREILAVYALRHIQCLLKSDKRQFCFLLGGTAQMHCSRQCIAFNEVAAMYREFKGYFTESHLDLLQFYRRYVKITGSLIYQAA